MFNKSLKQNNSGETVQTGLSMVDRVRNLSPDRKAVIGLAAVVVMLTGALVYAVASSSGGSPVVGGGVKEVKGIINTYSNLDAMDEYNRSQLDRLNKQIAGSVKGESGKGWALDFERYKAKQVEFYDKFLGQLLEARNSQKNGGGTDSGVFSRDVAAGVDARFRVGDVVEQLDVTGLPSHVRVGSLSRVFVGGVGVGWQSFVSVLAGESENYLLGVDVRFVGGKVREVSVRGFLSGSDAGFLGGAGDGVVGEGAVVGGFDGVGRVVGEDSAAPASDVPSVPSTTPPPSDVSAAPAPSDVSAAPPADPAAPPADPATPAPSAPSDIPTPLDGTTPPHETSGNSQLEGHIETPTTLEQTPITNQ